MVTSKAQHSAASSQLPPMPIPSKWIREGNPQATGAVLTQTSDQLVSSGLWECTAGRFDWVFEWDEFIHVLAGQAIITVEDGARIELNAGDTAFFPVGMKTEWYVPKWIRKTFTVRTLKPLE